MSIHKSALQKAFTEYCLSLDFKFEREKYDESYCQKDLSSDFKLLSHQRLGEQYFKARPDHRGCLFYWDIGSGKTLLAIHTAKYLIENQGFKRVHIIAPGVLGLNFINEVRKFKEYSSLEKYIEDFPSKNEKIKDNSIIIIDEIHIFMYGVINNHPETKDLWKKIFDKKTGIKIIALSATPIYESPFEISPLFNLLSGENLITRNGTEFYEEYVDDIYNDVHHAKRLRKLINGYVSHYSGIADYPEIYPEVTSFKRIIVNLSYGQEKYEKKDFTTDDIDDIVANLSCMEYKNITEASKNIDDYSPKIKELVQRLKKIDDGNIVIFSRYIHTIKLMMQYFKDSGFTEYDKNSNKSSKYVFKYINKSNYIDILNIYNNIKNVDSSVIHILIMDENMRYGVSLFNTRYIIVMEPHLSYNDFEQIIGRTRRLCSHIGLPKNKRNVSVFVMIAKNSLDEEILYNSIDYVKINQGFLKCFKEISIDRYLHKTLKTNNIFEEFQQNLIRI